MVRLLAHVRYAHVKMNILKVYSDPVEAAVKVGHGSSADSIKLGSMTKYRAEIRVRIFCEGTPLINEMVAAVTQSLYFMH